MIIYNQISSNNKVFGSEKNKISIITKNKVKNYPKTSKVKCAKYILDCIHSQIK